MDVWAYIVVHHYFVFWLSIATINLPVFFESILAKSIDNFVNKSLVRPSKLSTIPPSLC